MKAQLSVFLRVAILAFIALFGTLPRVGANELEPFDIEQSLQPLLEIQGHLDMTPTESSLSYSLKNISLDFGLSASGALAPLLLGGNRAVSLEWTRVDLRSETTAYPFRPTRREFRNPLEGLGHIFKSEENQKRLHAFARRFHAACEEIQAVPPANWRVGEFAATESFEAEGGVPGAVKIGSRVHLTLSWKPSSKSQDFKDAPRSTAFSGVLETMVQDLETISSQKIDSEFEITEFRIGVGEGKAFDFYLGKVSHGFRGTVSFVKEAGEVSRKSSGNQDGQYLLSLSDLGTAMMSIKRENFRKGLLRAMSLTGRIFNLVRTASLNARSWQISAIHASFDMSGNGKWYLPWVQNKAFSEVRFERIGRLKDEASDGLFSHTLTVQPLISFGLPATLRIHADPFLGMKWVSHGALRNGEPRQGEFEF